MAFLLIDFGASRIKAALSERGIPSSIKEFKPVAPCVAGGRFEVNPEALRALFRSVVKEYPSNIEGIIICSEMHGFILQRDDGSFASNYISWQDNRTTEALDSVSSLEQMQALFPKFKEYTGMRPKAGLPALNLFHLLRGREIPRGCYKMLSLPEIFGLEKGHSSMSAGFGVWDIYRETAYQELWDLYADYGCLLELNPVESSLSPAGSWQGIPVYTALGDNQCALYGCGLKPGQLILNLGTGSQIAYIDTPNPKHPMEQRPYMDGQMLSIITHIPSGRALNCFMGFLQDCLKFGGSQKNAWDVLQSVSLEELESSSLEFDLAVFASAHGFSRGGAVSNIGEKNFTFKEYTSSLLKSYIKQYLKIIEDNKLNKMPLLLAGGIPQKIPVLKQYLQKQGKALTGSVQQIDETLIGLNTVALSLK